jgi:hypothetical protein
MTRGLSRHTPSLEQARAAYDRRSWLEAYEAFARADEADALAAEDLELRAMTARMLARDDEAVEILERAHHAYLERGETPRAAYCAGWIGMTLFYGGAAGPAAGWIARTNRLLEDVPQESALHGYALLPTVFGQESAGNWEAAIAAAAKAAEIGRRHRDPELMALAIHAQGHMLVLSGRVPEGLALLDEAMVTVTTSELSPFVVGIVYCGVILACQAGFEVGRARGWTLELTRWVEQQQDLLAAGVERVLARTVCVQDGLPVLDDGRVLDVRNVVWCTGYRPDFSWIRFPFELGDDGYPVQYRGAVASSPGLYLAGLPFLHSFASMLVAGAGRDAERVARHIVQERAPQLRARSDEVALATAS